MLGLILGCIALGFDSCVALPPVSLQSYLRASCPSAFPTLPPSPAVAHGWQRAVFKPRARKHYKLYKPGDYSRNSAFVKNNRKIVSRQDAKSAKENQSCFESLNQLEAAFLSVLCVLARVKVSLYLK